MFLFLPTFIGKIWLVRPGKQTPSRSNIAVLMLYGHKAVSQAVFPSPINFTAFVTCTADLAVQVKIFFDKNGKQILS